MAQKPTHKALVFWTKPEGAALYVPHYIVGLPVAKRESRGVLNSELKITHPPNYQLHTESPSGRTSSEYLVRKTDNRRAMSP